MHSDQRTAIAGKYVIECEIDTGAMGRVYRATQLGLERTVALKIMNESGTEYRRRFLVEAHSMARMNHRNVVTVYDSGETDDGLVFIVMEYLRGRTLADAFESERRFDTLRALHLITQIARGLRAAHREGIVHRDLKPSNIFLVDDPDEIEIVKVFDFGIAKSRAITANHVDTSAGIIVGTPAYMAPEQIEGGPVDARTDLYALGVMLYLLLTGQTPFADANAIAVMSAHLNNKPRPPRSLCATIPEGVDALVMRLLAKKPADRFANTDELLRALAAQMVAIGGESFQSQATDSFPGFSAASFTAASFSAASFSAASFSAASFSAASGRSSLARTSTPPPAPLTGEHVVPRDMLQAEPLPRFDSPSPRTPAFILTPPRCATNVLVPDDDPMPSSWSSSSPAPNRARSPHEAHAKSAIREQRFSRIALGAIFLCASTAAVSTEGVLSTAFVAVNGVEQAVVQEATPAVDGDAAAAADAPAPVAGPMPAGPMPTTATAECFRGICGGPAAKQAVRTKAKAKALKRNVTKTRSTK